MAILNHLAASQSILKNNQEADVSKNLSGDDKEVPSGTEILLEASLWLYLNFLFLK
jgi:hypothetical protein